MAKFLRVLFGMSMTKHEIVTRVAGKTGLPNQQALEAVQGVLNCIAEALSNRQNVHLQDFGNFQLIYCKPRTRQNLHSRTPVLVGPHYRIKFNPARSLRLAMNIRPNEI